MHANDVACKLLHLFRCQTAPQFARQFIMTKTEVRRPTQLGLAARPPLPPTIPSPFPSWLLLGEGLGLIRRIELFRIAIRTVLANIKT